ncbi:MAG: hypothetical protein SOW15_00945, partial [Ruminococcus callidus]|nr:hypothetical protein [Ruminococcus callidus]
ATRSGGVAQAIRKNPSFIVLSSFQRSFFSLLYRKKQKDARGFCNFVRKSIFGFLWENLSDPSGRFATLSACGRSRLRRATGSHP